MFEFTLEDVRVAFLTLLRNKLLILLITLAGFCVGMLYTVRQPATFKYDATATVSVVFDAGVSQGPFSGVGVITNFAQIITSYSVAEYAAMLLADEGVTVQQIQSMVSTAGRYDPPILNITARSESPRLAILVANAAAESFVAQVSIITGTQSIQILDAARTAELYVSSDGRIIRLVAPIAAFIVACVLVVFFELKAGKLLSVKQCVTDMGELVAIIPKAGKKR